MTEIVTDTTDAERRALKISLRLDAIADNYEAVMPMIREALELGDHLALGYRSPGEYLRDRFGASLSRLPIPVRQAAVKELTDAGLSTRAIAPIFGVSHKTIVKDTQVVPEVPPEPIRESIRRGLDQASAGVTVRRDDLIVNHETGEILDAPEPRKVTGLDGKSYTRPEPKAPRALPRRAISDQFFDAVFDMEQAIKRVHRLTEDDRWGQNAEKVAAKHRVDLLRANDLLAEVINRLA